MRKWLEYREKTESSTLSTKSINCSKIESPISEYKKQ